MNVSAQESSNLILSSLIIAFSYFIISTSLTYFYYKKSKVIKDTYIIILFILFIFLCGLIHLLNILVMYYRIEKLLIFIKTITAGISLVTAMLLPKVIKNLLTYKSPQEYKLIEQQFQELAEEKKKLLNRIKEINHGLANRLQYLDNMLASSEWISKNQIKLQELKTIVEDLRREYKINL